MEEAAMGVEDAHDDDSPVRVLSHEELLPAIQKQVEFYFSDTNLPTDKHLLRQIQKDPEGFVAVKVIANYKRVKALCKDIKVVVEAMKHSPALVVSEDDKRVRRREAIPEFDIHDIQRRTVLAEHLPGTPTIDSVTELFAKVGTVKMVRICSKGATSKLPRWLTNALNVNWSNAQFALIEYSNEEEAIAAVNQLGSDGSWGQGLRVRHLLRDFKNGERISRPASAANSFTSSLGAGSRPSSFTDKGAHLLGDAADAAARGAWVPPSRRATEGGGGGGGAGSVDRHSRSGTTSNGGSRQGTPESRLPAIRTSAADSASSWRTPRALDGVTGSATKLPSGAKQRRSSVAGLPATGPQPKIELDSAAPSAPCSPLAGGSRAAGLDLGGQKAADSYIHSFIGNILKGPTNPNSKPGSPLIRGISGAAGGGLGSPFASSATGSPRASGGGVGNPFSLSGLHRSTLDGGAPASRDASPQNTAETGGDTTVTELDDDSSSGAATSGELLAAAASAAATAATAKGGLNAGKPASLTVPQLERKLSNLNVDSPIFVPKAMMHPAVALTAAGKTDSNSDSDDHGRPPKPRGSTAGAPAATVPSAAAAASAAAASATVAAAMAAATAAATAPGRARRSSWHVGFEDVNAQLSNLSKAAGSGAGPERHLTEGGAAAQPRSARSRDNSQDRQRRRMSASEGGAGGHGGPGGAAAEARADSKKKGGPSTPVPIPKDRKQRRTSSRRTSLDGGETERGDRGEGDPDHGKANKHAAEAKAKQKKDYAAWAAATDHYRGEAIAAKGQGVGGGKAGVAIVGSPLQSNGMRPIIKHGSGVAPVEPRMPDGTKGFSMGRGKPLPKQG